MEKTKNNHALPAIPERTFTKLEKMTQTPTTQNSFQSREIAVTGSFYFCEVCNSVCEYGDPIWQEHQNESKFHKMKKMLLLRCAHCGTVVVDAYAEYSPERNQFWCRNCIGDVGYLIFRSDVVPQSPTS